MFEVKDLGLWVLTFSYSPGYQYDRINNELFLEDEHRIGLITLCLVTKDESRTGGGTFRKITK